MTQLSAIKISDTTSYLSMYMLICYVASCLKDLSVYGFIFFSQKHVDMADEAVCIGPAPSNESYLVIDKVIDACRQTGAQAVSVI